MTVGGRELSMAVLKIMRKISSNSVRNSVLASRSEGQLSFVGIFCSVNHSVERDVNSTHSLTHSRVHSLCSVIN